MPSRRSFLTGLFATTGTAACATNFRFQSGVLHRFRPGPLPGGLASRLGLNVTHGPISTNNAIPDARHTDLTHVPGAWTQLGYGMGSQTVFADTYGNPLIESSNTAGIGLKPFELLDPSWVGDTVVIVPSDVNLPNLDGFDDASQKPTIRAGADLGNGTKEIIINFPIGVQYDANGFIVPSSVTKGRFSFDLASATSMMNAAKAGRRITWKRRGDTSTGRFTNAHAAMNAGGACVRFLDPMTTNERNTNGYDSYPDAPIKWADMPHIGSSSFEDISAELRQRAVNGISYADAWFALRSGESVDWFTGLCNALAGLSWWKGKLRFEYGNELWNSAFPVRNYVQRDGMLAGYGVGNGSQPAVAVGTRYDMEYQGADHLYRADGSQAADYWEFGGNSTSFNRLPHQAGAIFFHRSEGEGEKLYKCVRTVAAGGASFSDTTYFQDIGGDAGLALERYTCEALRKYAAIADGILGAARVIPQLNRQCGNADMYLSAMTWSPQGSGGPTLAQRAAIGPVNIAAAPYIGGGAAGFDYGNFSDAPAAVKAAAAGPPRREAIVAAYNDPQMLAAMKAYIPQMKASWSYGTLDVYEVGDHTVFSTAWQVDLTQLSADINAVRADDRLIPPIKDFLAYLLATCGMVCFYCENDPMYAAYLGSDGKMAGTFRRWGLRRTGLDRDSNAWLKAYEQLRLAA